jgi:hypothetical protein
VPFESITYVAHDTARVSAGGGSHSGRSMKLAATIIGEATDDIIDRGRKIASFMLETGEIDIGFERGRYRVVGTDREVSIFEVTAAAVTRKDLPEDLQGPLAGISDQTLPSPASRTERRSAKSRLIPKRARLKSCGTLQLTMSGADPARSDARRNCPRCRPGAAREQLLGARDWAAARGELHGLRDASRRHAAVPGHRAQRSARADE